MGLLDGFLSLARNINKVKTTDDETRQGVVSDFTDELTLEKDDKELSELAKSWENRWNESEAKKELDRKQKENEKYWLGDHHTPAQKATGKRELVDNLIFEAVETSLPFYTKQNAEPIVGHDNTPEGQSQANKVGDRLKDLADTLRLKLKVKKAARHWALYFLGAIKVGWSSDKNEIAVQVVRPQTLILDPDAITDECEYEGEYVGQYRTDTAANLIKIYPSKAAFITDKVQKKLGTKLRYVEWWTNDYVFWSLEGEVLDKAKNPHWNYDTEIVNETVDEFGQPKQEKVVNQGLNHFSSRKVPYGFLSVFNLGKYPYDDTNQIEQTIPQQDLINKRQRQIDRNADQMNAGAVVSGDAFTREQAKQVSDALRRGATVWVPRGNVNSVYKRDAGTPLPEFIYQSLVDARNELRNIFGTTGLSSQGLRQTETVRGKILVKGADADRSTYIVDHLEQLYDYIYNWMVQLMYVYYDEPRRVSRYQGTTTIVNNELTHPMVVSVKEGSLIPKDRLTQRNEAIDLWSSNAIDPITLYEKLEEPDPYERAKRLYLWQKDPLRLFPDLQQQMQQEAAQAVISAGGASPVPGGPPVEEGEGVAQEENLLSQVPIQ